MAENIPFEESVEELALAMLYLGEGSKSWGRVQMASTDPRILKFFIHSLHSLYHINLDMLTFRLNLIPAAQLFETDYQTWWLKVLGVSKGRFLKTQYDRRSKDQHISDDYHGVFTITLNQTLLQQRLLGIAYCYIETRSRGVLGK